MPPRGFLLGVPVPYSPGKENEPVLSISERIARRKLDASCSDEGDLKPGVARALTGSLQAVDDVNVPIVERLKQSRSLLSDSLATISLLETNAHLLQKRREEYQLERITLKADVEREKRAYERVADESRDAEITAGRLEVKRQRLEDEKMRMAIKHVQEKEKMMAEREEAEKVFREERETLQKESEQLKTKLEQSKKLVKELVKKEPYRRAKTVGTDNDSD